MKLLFTKNISAAKLESYFSPPIALKSLDFITTEYRELETLSPQIPENAQHFLITSVKGAEVAVQLGLKGNFYCVGKKAADYLTSRSELTEKGIKVLWVAENGARMRDWVLKNGDKEGKWVYLCSQIRQDELPQSMLQAHFDLTEIVAYNTFYREVQLFDSYDVYVFFSPSGVNSFAKQYEFPKNAIIFAIGKTTAAALERITKKEIKCSPKPNLETLLNYIKQEIDA